MNSNLRVCGVLWVKALELRGAVMRVALRKLFLGVRVRRLLTSSTLSVTNLVATGRPALTRQCRRFGTIYRSHFSVLGSGRRRLGHVFVSVCNLRSRLAPSMTPGSIAIRQVFSDGSSIPSSLRNDGCILAGRSIVGSLLSCTMNYLFNHCSLSAPNLTCTNNR